MNEQSALQAGDKIVSLSSLSRYVGVVSALAAAISYQVVYGSPDFFTIFIVFVTALLIGVTVGWIVSMRFTSVGRDGTATVVKHGRDGVPVTIRTALVVAAVIAVIFILIAKFALGFDGNLFGLLATISLPAIAIATVWALLGSLA